MNTTSKTPARKQTDAPVKTSARSEIDAFVSAAREMPHASSGRMIFALDATMSRQATWDMACHLQARMFDKTGQRSDLAVQLIFFRGMGECKASKFVTDTGHLRRLMTGLSCQGGLTQIGKVIQRALDEHAKSKVSALVYIGDAMEEDVDHLCNIAGTLGLKGLPMFIFQEGHDGVTERAFREFARLSGGAFFRFDRNAPDALGDLLAAISLYARKGRPALEARGGRADRLLLEQMSGKGGRRSP